MYTAVAGVIAASKERACGGFDILAWYAALSLWQVSAIISTCTVLVT